MCVTPSQKGERNANAIDLCINVLAHADGLQAEILSTPCFPLFISSARWPWLGFAWWNCSKFQLSLSFVEQFFFLLYDHITSRSLGAAGQRCQVLSLIDYLLPSTSLPEGWRGVFLSATAATRRARAGRYYSSIHPGVHPSECNLLMVAGSMASMVVE